MFFDIKYCHCAYSFFSQHLLARRSQSCYLATFSSIFISPTNSIQSFYNLVSYYHLQSFTHLHTSHCLIEVSSAATCLKRYLLAKQQLRCSAYSFEPGILSSTTTLSTHIEKPSLLFHQISLLQYHSVRKKSHLLLKHIEDPYQQWLLYFQSPFPTLPLSKQ